MENSSKRAFLVTKHAIGTIIEPPEQHPDGPWVLESTQVIAVMRAKDDAPAPHKLSKMEIERQRREWLLADPLRHEDDFTPVDRPIRNPQFEYLDETVYATWSMS